MHLLMRVVKTFLYNYSHTHTHTHTHTYIYIVCIQLGFDLYPRRTTYCIYEDLHPKALFFENLMLEFEILVFNPKTQNVKMLNHSKKFHR
jgi:hypothetical protein